MMLKIGFQKSDNALIRQVAKGDKKAFALIFDRYGATVLGYLGGMLARTSLNAEDVSQSVWEKVIRSASTYQGNGFKSWLFSIVRNSAFDELRRIAKAKEESFDEENIVDCENGFFDVEKFLSEQGRVQELKRNIARLPDRQRIALVAWLEGDVCQKTLASELGITVKALEQLLIRAKGNLKSMMEASHEKAE